MSRWPICSHLLKTSDFDTEKQDDFIQTFQNIFSWPNFASNMISKNNSKNLIKRQNSLLFQKYCQD